ncbi:hypothetical protein QTP88_022389 [Uroleucon formosanum]
MENRYAIAVADGDDDQEDKEEEKEEKEEEEEKTVEVIGPLEQRGRLKKKSAYTYASAAAKYVLLRRRNTEKSNPRAHGIILYRGNISAGRRRKRNETCDVEEKNIQYCVCVCVCVCAIGANDVRPMSLNSLKSATVATNKTATLPALCNARPCDGGAIGSKTFRALARQVAAPLVVYARPMPPFAVDDRAAIFFLRCIRMHATRRIGFPRTREIAARRTDDFELGTVLRAGSKLFDAIMQFRRNTGAAAIVFTKRTDNRVSVVSCWRTEEVLPPYVTPIKNASGATVL